MWKVSGEGRDLPVVRVSRDGKRLNLGGFLLSVIGAFGGASNRRMKENPKLTSGRKGRLEP